MSYVNHGGEATSFHKVASLRPEKPDLGGSRRSLWEHPVKRVFDVAAALLATLFFVPFFVLTYILLHASVGGPVFYASKRLGRNGEAFYAYKFRTMYPNSDAILEQHLADNPSACTEWQLTHKLRRDPRVHWVGRLLRKSSLDELPQLLNVIRGEMSIVGPRPIFESDVETYGPNIATYVKMRPGLTGLWQVNGRSDTTFEQRIAYDTTYYHKLSAFQDFRIMCKTVIVVATGQGAY